MSISLNHINTPKALSSPALSHAVQVGDLVFVSGQVGIKPETAQAPVELRDEIEVAFDALEAVLDAAGSSLRSVVRTTCYLRSVEDMDQFNVAYMRRFAEPRPGRTTIQATLAMGLRFEIDAVAVVDH